MKNSLLLSAFLILRLFNPALAQVSADDNAVVSAQPSSPASSFTIKNFTVPVGNDVALLIVSRNGGFATITNINFNGTDYTTNNVGTGSAGGHRSEIWAIPLGNIGSALTNQTITVTLSGSPGIQGAFAATFTNVNQTTPANNFTSEVDGDLSIDVTSSSGDMVIDGISSRNIPNFSVGTAQTVLINNALMDSGGDVKLSGSYELSSGASTTMNWTNSGGALNLLHLGANIQSNGVLLPVELIAFNATLIENREVKLDWQTASELNNFGFEIQKSKDSRNWEIIEFVEGNGTTNENNDYEFIDGIPYLGFNYYRLKQIDFDGKFEFSNIEVVKTKETEIQIEVFPNPSPSEINVSINNPSEKRMRIILSDKLGRKIWNSEAIENNPVWKKEFQFDQSDIYFISVQIGNQVINKKLMVIGKK